MNAELHSGRTHDEAQISDPRVQVFLGAYLPGFRSGGPIQSVAREIAMDRKFRIRLATRNRDSGESTPYPGVVVRQWGSNGNAEVAYLGRFWDWLWLVREVRRFRPQIYYLSSVFDSLSVMALAGLRLGILPRATIALAPRGECSPGALAIKSKRKSLFKPLIRALLPRRLVWHVSSPLEEAEVRSWLGGRVDSGQYFLVRANLPTVPLVGPSIGGPDSKPVVAFASRVHPKKGLIFAIEQLQHVTKRCDFVIAGTIADASYWDACLKACESMPDNIDVHLRGPYQPSEGQAIFSGADLFFFPSAGENFGHAIAEALSVGCPVLTRRGVTPWDEVLEAGGGYLFDSGSEATDFVESYLDPSNKSRRTADRAAALEAYSRWFYGPRFSSPSEQGRAEWSVFEEIAHASSMRGIDERWGPKR